jgi:hypothetical protein
MPLAPEAGRLGSALQNPCYGACFAIGRNRQLAPRCAKGSCRCSSADFTVFLPMRSLSTLEKLAAQGSSKNTRQATPLIRRMSIS